jgi:hypothetical protein
MILIFICFLITFIVYISNILLANQILILINYTFLYICCNWFIPIFLVNYFSSNHFLLMLTNVNNSYLHNLLQQFTSFSVLCYNSSIDIYLQMLLYVFFLFIKTNMVIIKFNLTTETNIMLNISNLYLILLLNTKDG